MVPMEYRKYEFRGFDCDHSLVTYFGLHSMLIPHSLHIE